MNNIANEMMVNNLVQQKFKTLKLAHFQLYAKQLGITVRKAKALLKSDTTYQPVSAMLLINALIEEVGKADGDLTDYIIGDVVVFKDAHKSNQLMTVSDIKGDGVLLDDDSKFALNHLLRHASVAEVQARQRLDTLNPVLSSDIEMHLHRAMAAQGEVS